MGDQMPRDNGEIGAVVHTSPNIHTDFSMETKVSTRTVIEINHDYIADLVRDPGEFLDLLKTLTGSEITAALNRGEVPRFWSGITVLGQRHHSQTLKLEVK